MKPTIRSIVRKNTSSSKTIEPTWQCSPATSRLFMPSAARTNSMACPVSTGTPNFTSTAPVLIAW